MQIVLRIVNNRSAWRGAVFIVLFLCLPAGRHMAGAGEASGPVTPSELQALDRAISREINSSHLGSQILGDLVRLRTKLQALRDTPEPDPALPAGPGEAPEQVVRRLEAQAASGNRNALRSLSFYHMYLNDPEKALAAWRRMGKANDYDLAYLIVSSYLELALGEYNAGRRNLEAAVRFMDTRASLAVSNPLFCQTIAGYRLYEPRRQGDLLPGEDVLVYVELDGVDFVRTTDGMSECAIMFGLKLRDDASQAVRWAEPNFGEYKPLFAGPIRDLHAALTWRVPNDLEPGRYHLHVEAVEETSKRRGEGIIGFNVGKRETNPERRPTTVLPGLDPTNVPPGYYDPNNIYEMQRKAMQMFPGASMPEPEDQREPGYYKDRFDIIRDYHRGQKVD